MAPWEDRAVPVISPSLRCPLCRTPFTLQERTACCEGGHRFDVARQGYLHLAVHGRADKSKAGYDKDMVRRRRETFARGWYAPMRAGVVAAVVAADPGEGAVVDLGCGEGYYTGEVARSLPGREVVGLDLSKAGVAMAAAADKAPTYVVANAYDVPVADATAGVVLSVFSPVPDAELRRLLRPDGRVVTAQPAPGHLRSLKAALYDEPRPFEVRPLLDGPWRVTDERVVETTLDVSAPGDLATLVEMTPYAHSAAYRARRDTLALDAVEVAFLVRTWTPGT